MVSSRDQARKLEPMPRLMSVWGSDEHYRRLNGILDTEFVIISTGMKSLHKLLQFCIQDMTMTMTKKLVGSRCSAHFQVCRPLQLVWTKKRVTGVVKSDFFMIEREIAHAVMQGNGRKLLAYIF